MTPPPEYLQHRVDMFDKIKAEYDAEIASNIFLKNNVKMHKL